MILDLDIGNSSIKWRIVQANGKKTNVKNTTLSAIVDATFRPERSGIQRIRVSSVRAGNVREDVSVWAQALYGVTPEFAISSRRVGRVLNGYENPPALGVDRWLAMLAAFELTQDAVCVFDLGSAMTADLLDESGKHIGGFIAPGMRLMLDSLLSGTDLVRFTLRDTPGCLVPANSTQGAVEGGVLAAASGFVSACWERFRLVAPTARAFVTGGDAPAVLPMLNFPATLQPDLVLDGLAVALP